MRVFCSYSHKDEKYRQDLEVHLASLRRQMLLDELWHDRLIQPGKDWQREISMHIECADIVILLITSHFIASNYCWGIELEHALARQQEGRCIVIPIIVRECDWENTLVGGLQALPRNGRAITSARWKNQDEAWTDVAKRLGELIRELRTVKGKARVEDADELTLNRADLRGDSSQEFSGVQEGNWSLSLTGDECILTATKLVDRYYVQIVPDITSLTRGRDFSVRTSQIFSTKGADTKSSPTSFIFNNNNALILLGPTAPALVKECCSKACDIWLSVGLFNVIINTPIQDEALRIISWANGRAIRYEVWWISDGFVKDITQSHGSDDRLKWQNEFLEKNIYHTPELRQSVNEYCELMATAFSYLSQSVQCLCHELESIDEFITDQFAHASAESAESDLLLVEEVNNALFMLISKSLICDAPLLKSGKASTANSLLGNGIAILALGKLLAFASQALREACLLERFMSLGAAVTDVPSLLALPGEDPFWSNDLLDKITTPALDHSDRLTAIPYLSHHEGYRMKNLSIAAPLIIVSGCNSLRWSPVIISHEISHAIVRAILSRLIPVTDDELDHAIQNIKLVKSVSLGDEIQRYFLFSMLMLEEDLDTLIDAQTLQRNIKKFLPHVEEIMATTLDYLYFYGEEAETFVKTYWLQWISVPKAADWVEVHIINTVASIEASHLRRGAVSSEKIAVMQTRQILKDLEQSGHRHRYISEAINYLDEQQHFGYLLSKRKPFVKFVRAFLYSPKLAASLKASAGADAMPHMLELSKPHNPFKLLWSVCDDSDPSAPLSAWILNALAF